MPKIFISYGRDGSHGQNLATQAQQQLQDAGFDVFRDVIGLNPGDVWYSKLEFELDTSDLVVLVVSEKVRTSEWVHNEISMAKEIGLPIIPVIAEPVRMPLWLRHLQALDFSDQADWQTLLNAVGGHIGLPDISHKADIPLSASAAELKGVVARATDQAPKNSRVISTNDHVPSWASHVGKDQYGHYADLDINNVIQRFRFIKPGTFQMGSPTSEEEREYGGKETLHRVTISNAFWLADTACTQALWQAVMGGNPSHFKGYFKRNNNNPVENVSWDDTQAFFQALVQMKPELSFQLPTEAQWEYACRAGTQTPFSFGENITPEQVNYHGDYPYASGAKGMYRGKTVPVKSLPANSWGLYEMHGNVWEWCRDNYQEDLGSQAQTDPFIEFGVGARRVVRGGSWDDGGSVRSAYRYRNSPDLRGSNLGFRLFLSTSAER